MPASSLNDLVDLCSKSIIPCTRPNLHVHSWPFLLSSYESWQGLLETFEIGLSLNCFHSRSSLWWPVFVLLTMGDCRLDVGVQQSWRKWTDAFALNTVYTCILPWTQTVFKVYVPIRNSPNLKFFDFPLWKPIVGCCSLFLFRHQDIGLLVYINGSGG